MNLVRHLGGIWSSCWVVVKRFDVGACTLLTKGSQRGAVQDRHFDIGLVSFFGASTHTQGDASALRRADTWSSVRFVSLWLFGGAGMEGSAQGGGGYRWLADTHIQGNTSASRRVDTELRV